MTSLPVRAGSLGWQRVCALWLAVAGGCGRLGAPPPTDNHADSAADDAAPPASDSNPAPIGGPPAGPTPRPAGAPALVVVDAGHGGTDFGALSLSGVHEKDVALAVARATAAALRAQGVDVLELRTDDSTLPLPRRTELANVSGAALYLSIHANSAPGSGARGVEVYSLDLASDAASQRVAARENLAGWVEGKDGPFRATELDDLVSDLRVGARAEHGRAWARAVHQELLLGMAAIYGTEQAHDHGLRTAPFWVLADSDVPAILVEVGYLTHEEDEVRIRSSGFQRAAADAIARATADFVSRSRNLNGP